MKRGTLVAAANWPVTLIQATADALFKLLVAVPLVGGVFLVALAVGAEPDTLLALEWRELVATIVTSLLSRPLVLAPFLASLAVVMAGGSLFIFLLKAGTVSVLVRGERVAGPIEQPPLSLDALSQASVFSIEFFTESAKRLFPRYARLGFVLMGLYLVSGGLLLFGLVASRTSSDGWGATALLTAAFVSWITFVNLLYLLTQIVIAADDCSVVAAASKVAGLLRRERRSVAGIFVVVLAFVVFATGASFLATASLSLLAFVPFFGPFLGLAVLPLQLLAWALRAVVFQYIGLSSIGAYLAVYRDQSMGAATQRVGRDAKHPGDVVQAAAERHGVS
jgi:hypothetical protein